MEKEIIRNEKRWYYEVPKEYVLFNKKEEKLFDGNLQQCAEIDFARPPLIPKIWRQGQPIDLFSSANFLWDFFWNLKKTGEKMQIKVLEGVEFHKDINSADIKTKEKLLEIMEYLSAYGPESGILYRNAEEIKRAVILQPSEGMRIYLSEEEVPAMKKYLSNFGEETDYNSYQLDELEY